MVMDFLNENIEDISTSADGRLHMMVGLCENMGIQDIINKHLGNFGPGRPPDILPGTEALVLLSCMCVERGYRPLYLIQDFFQHKDLEGIFHCPMELSQLTDDRFGIFLDNFHNAGCRKIFREISWQAFQKYGLSISNINYDTTSKVMWGEYETSGGKTEKEQVYITFGHSKQKRKDKKQIKIGLGATQGVVVDAKVLSGNLDDKTYNEENIEDVDQLLTQMEVERDSFYYIADSAFFTKETIKNANEKRVNFITRIPDKYKIAESRLVTPLSENAQRIFE